MIFGVNQARMAARIFRLRRKCRSPATSAFRVALFAKADPRVDQGVQKVDHEIDDDKRDRVGEHGASDQRIIPRLDRGDQQRTAARPREHGLDDDGSAQQRAELEADYRDDRNERIAKHVPHRTVFSPRPFARAVRTKSSLMISSTEERVTRMMSPIMAVPRATAGMMMCLMPSHTAFMLPESRLCRM